MCDVICSWHLPSVTNCHTFSDPRPSSVTYILDGPWPGLPRRHDDYDDNNDDNDDDDDWRRAMDRIDLLYRWCLDTRCSWYCCFCCCSCFCCCCFCCRCFFWCCCDLYLVHVGSTDDLPSETESFRVTYIQIALQNIKRSLSIVTSTHKLYHHLNGWLAVN